MEEDVSSLAEERPLRRPESHLQLPAPRRADLGRPEWGCTCSPESRAGEGSGSTDSDCQRGTGLLWEVGVLCTGSRGTRTRPVFGAGRGGDSRTRQG